MAKSSSPSGKNSIERLSPIGDLIRERGPLTVAAFMDFALYDSEHGYYARTAQRSGRAGDFFTSVDVGPIFGELMEAQLAEMAGILSSRFSIPSVDLVEAGAGNGRLAADILRAAHAHHPGVYESLRLHLVEASAGARAAQRATLGETADRLASSGDTLPASFEGVLLANELLDALPVHQVVMRADGLHEVYVQATDVARPFQGRDPSVLDVMKARVGTFATNKFTNAIQNSTIALTWFRSGVGDPPKINVIPSVAEAGLDCRVLPGTTRDQWIAEVKRRLGDPEIAIELINESDDPIVTSQDTPLYRHLEAAIKRRHPEAVVTPMLIPYGTDSNAFRPKGVKSYGVFPAILSGETVASMHGDGERVPLDGIGEAAQVFFEALKATLEK